MTPQEAADGVTVTGPYGEGILCRQANGWDLIVGDHVYQSIDLAAHTPLSEHPPLHEIRTGDRISIKPKETQR